MSGHLLLAAIAADEEFSSDCEAASLNGKDEGGVAEAISHTPKSRKGKKRKSPGAGGGTAAKKTKMENRNLEAAAGADGLTQSMFVEGVCIPMWPQYVDKAASCNFIRIGTQEDWVNQFMVASRKAVAQSKKKDETPKERKNGRGISSNAYVTKFTGNLRKRRSQLERTKRDRRASLAIVS